MRATTTLSRLTYDHLTDSPAWRAIGDYANADDQTLEAIRYAGCRPIPASVQEVWCLCIAKFANGSEHSACAMCRGDSADGPLAWSVWNGEEDVPVIVPPAPPPVLEIDGPGVFASRFALSVQEVFPIVFEVVPRFVVRPEKRAAILDVAGVRKL